MTRLAIPALALCAAALMAVGITGTPRHISTVIAVPPPR